MKMNSSSNTTTTTNNNNNNNNRVKTSKFYSKWEFANSSILPNNVSDIFV
jgi:hypothetical protein